MACAEVLTLQPEHPDALQLLGELAQAQGQLGQAEGLLQRALQTEPQRAATWYRLGDIQDDQRRWADAEASFRRAVELDPEHVAAHYSRARVLHTLGQADSAAASVAMALSLRPAAPVLLAQILQLQALLHDEAGHLDVALVTLDQALLAAPQRVALHHNRGVLLQRLARPSDALAAHDRALALGLVAADAHYNRGNSLQSLGRSDEAMLAYQAALRLDPQHGLALYDSARLRWRQGEADFTVDLDAAAAAAPGSAVPLGIKGRLLLRAERYEDAAAAFGQAAALADTVPGYFDGLGQALSRLGRFDTALAAHRRAVALAPQQAGGHISHATSLLQAGQTALAVGAAETAVRLDPLDQQAWATLGLAWRATGHPAEAWLHDYAQHVQAFDLPPPEGWSDMTSFNLALAAALEAMHIDAQAPVDQTLRHGSQTMDNIFDQAHPLVMQLKGRIAQAVDRYIAHLDSLPADESHPLLGRTSPRWRYTDSWSSRLRSSGFHTNHVHTHGWISSCYYVALPPVMTQGEGSDGRRDGWISFGAPDIAVPGCDLSARLHVRPQVGRLVLFPSCMWHGTLPFTDTLPRLTIAFDVVPLD